jgi:hypothetical protein
MSPRKVSLGKRFVSATAGLMLLLALAPAAHAQKLGTTALPSSVLAGANNAYVLGTGFPSGTLTPATISFAATCGGSAIATTPVTVASKQSPFEKFVFAIPSTLATGSYFVTVSGPGYNTATEATPSCSQISVTATTTTLAACVPTSSLAVVAGTNVNAYVPAGYWEGGDSGVAEVPLEGTGTATTFTTPGAVNSCAANSVTGEVVCTENGTNVDLINGTTLTTLTSSADDFAGFSGGSCENCGVAVNAANNTAIIAGGFSGESGDGVQLLNLANNTFSTPFPMYHTVSEDISIDSGRNYLLSPDESGYFELLTLNSSGLPSAEYSMYMSPAGEPDSAAEDCTTGIALSSLEFSDDIFITDLTQATLTPGAPGTWTAPSQQIDLSDYGYSAGTCGLSSAPGTNHLAVVTGEFGGSAYSALALPSTSGSGTPTLADYAYVYFMPNTPNGDGFSAGYDPHTVTAYTSPNTGKSYAVFADYAGYSTHPPYLGIVDLACVLSLDRIPGTHIVNDQTSTTSTTAGDASACTSYVAVP